MPRLTRRLPSSPCQKSGRTPAFRSSPLREYQPRPRIQPPAPVQNAIIGNDTSLFGGVIGVVMLFATNAVVLRLFYRGPHRSLRGEGGGDVTLISDGKPDDAMLTRFHLNRTELLVKAHERGFDRIWLMDDDVVPAPDCLTVLMAQDEACLMAVREDTTGALVEKAAVRFDLRNPLAIRPKTAMVETEFGHRHRMPHRVELHNVAFEGFMVRREVVDAIGLPDPSFFIFYDDVDYALRARRAGYRIWAVRDAVLVRQLDFDQQHDLGGWKGYYMYRNLFVVHLRYGENALVRAKPWLITAMVVALSPVRGGLAEARNVIRAMRDARGMRAGPARSVD